VGERNVEEEWKRFLVWWDCTLCTVPGSKSVANSFILFALCLSRGIQVLAYLLIVETLESPNKQVRSFLSACLLP
jgi:hypothetical protein